MSKVNHKHINGSVDVFADHFPSVLMDALDNLLDAAVALGRTVDWSTLEIEAPETVEVRNGYGLREWITSADMQISVDSIAIEEDE